MNKEELKKLAENATEQEVKNLALAELQKIELQEKAAQGDALSRSLLALKDTIDAFKQKSTGASLSPDDVKKLMASAQSGGIKGRVSYNDLDPELQSKLSGSVKTYLTLTTPTTKGGGKGIEERQVNRPLFQKLLSDFLARNNVYLYGGAGTGKTFIVEQLADFLGYDYVEVNCNQFTSPLDLVGGQTIEGYQKGKLEMAWTNIDKQGNEMRGAVLCLDELPKLDPNTAGVLNAALAKIKLGTSDNPAYIYNGKGEKIFKRNIFVVATGNTQLNDTSVEYEANFKQDLSLQDRFVGATYEVLADYRSEFEGALANFAFLFIFMTKIREAIIERRLTGVAFVSYRILITLRDTYIVERTESLKDSLQYTPSNQTDERSAIVKVKTLKEGLDSFLNLFNDTQRKYLEEASDYNNFVNTILAEKMKLPMDKQNTEAELKEVEAIINRNDEKLALANK
jgi:cobaltochelatase CobS